MSFDKDTRNTLSKMVAACRRLMTEDVTDQLRGRFGMHPDGTILAIDRLDLAEDEKAAAESLRELLDHFAAGEAGRANERRRRAYDRLVLEISFTALNRLAALRLCEERALVVECVRQGTASDGFRIFERVAGGALGTRYQTYRVFIDGLFDELAQDLGVLFDGTTPQSAVFPSERCLDDVLAELNRPELAPLWAADETIGWIYQYFNPPEERKAMRDASQAPRNSRELAVRNQFFTPRYVVEFLTDNTLGRIWYEMRKGETALVDDCRYLVRRPTEIFLGPGETAPPAGEADTDLSQEELLKQPVHVEHRPKKDPRDLRVLDPACGSGHFLLYAFDLLERIYEEAWQDPQGPKFEATGKSLREAFETIEGLRRAAPKLIVEHNLHGIDIDPRAVQIAALALWLRAQKAWKALGLKATDRPRIERSNIVTAEPMPGEEDMRREFTARLTPRVLGQLVDVVFEKMKLAGEAGSLLKIEEEIRDAVAAAKAEFVVEQRRRRDEAGYFPGMAPPRDATLFDFTDLSEEAFWEQAEDRILAALKAYAEQAENGHAVRRRLFVKDAAQGFAFIDLCRRRYDVALMNPPFGDAATPALASLESALSACGRDIGGAFVREAALRWTQNGRIGVLLSTGPWFKPFFELWRSDVFFGEKCQLDVCAHFGGEVLDGATVNASPLVLSAPTAGVCEVFRLTRHADLEAGLRSCVSGVNTGDRTSETYRVAPREVCVLPGRPFCYWMSRHLLRRISRLPSFEGTGGTVKQGTATADEPRFCRAWWELPEDGHGAEWCPYTKTSTYSPYWDDITWMGKLGGHQTELQATGRARVQGVEFFGRPGVTYTSKSVLGFNPRLQPPGCAFGHSGSVAFGDDVDPLAMLGFIGSRPVEYLLSLFIGELQGKAGVHPNQYEVGTVQRLPWPGLSSEQKSVLTRAAARAVSALKSLDAGDEITRSFEGAIADVSASLSENARSAIERESEAVLQVCQARREADEAVGQAYGFTPTDMAEMDAAFADRVPPASGKWRVYFGEHGSDLDTRAYAERIVSWVVGVGFGRWKAALPTVFAGDDADSKTLLTAPVAQPPALEVGGGVGVLVDDSGFNASQPHRDDIVRRTREVLDLLWKGQAHKIEQEACAILGVKDLRDYFRKPTGFFQDHLKRYSKSRRKAPIYWPLSTASGSYTIWLYYHRLTDQTIYAAVNKYVEPKITDVEHAAAHIEKELETASGREATRLRDRLNEARALVAELRELREELLRIAGLPCKPNLNDGAIINAAPFHNLFRLRPWAKEAEEVWKKLEKGEYDWAHLAYTIWPDRVRETCRKDRSIAIAHGLEDLCEVEPPASKGRGKGKGRKKKEVKG